MDSGNRMKQVCVTDVPNCFISDHEGFTGTIKNYTKDFVVTEIDIHQQLVNTLVVGPQGIDQPSPDAFPAKSKINKKCKQDSTIFPPDIDPSSLVDLDLRTLLGLSVYEELERFLITTQNDSDTKKDELNPQTQSPSPDMSLGSFPEKHQRMAVHRALRHHFPSLMTVTHQFEIKVRDNPDYRELSGLVTEEESEEFFRFIDAKVSGSTYTFRPDEVKDRRTAVHHFLSRRFGKLVETKSFNDPGGTVISVRLRPRKRTKDDSVEEEVYTAFTLRKENLETLEAISYMAATLGASASDFSYAGIKDKRAVTYQAMVVKNVPVRRLTEKVAELERRGLRVTQVRPASAPLHLGRLAGNHFDLVVRHLRLHADGDRQGGGQRGVADAVERAVENIKARGFVNYYGPQRFGISQSVQSDRVGLALLKEDMVGAVRLFFTPENGDEPHNQAKRHFIQTENAKESLVLMPASKARERLMLRALHRYGPGADGCTRAWLSLPHGMRVFYPHAYCSRVWNDAVAHRLATLGHAPIQGDLVWQQQDPQGDMGESNPPQIHVVSAEEERDGVYTLAQVVLPMPGNTVTYPQNAMGAWYQERLAGDGLGDARFRITGLKLNLPGCYRPLVVTPRNITHRLQERREEEKEEEERGGEGRGGEEMARRRESEKAPLTLVLNFDLVSSSYATVCLREMMKCDV
ncbi:pseudouridylate synthase PUS7L [Gadus morhua]|uniref:Pseudouridylate synthase PUS7L n=1 Tax=Gadus morhua TaxID=8049 RepID=A0A8C5AZF6_GADMO|nr:pseudouridylate synthase 7 homolog-like protein [Gadus morhua]